MLRVIVGLGVFALLMAGTEISLIFVKALSGIDLGLWILAAFTLTGVSVFSAITVALITVMFGKD